MTERFDSRPHKGKPLGQNKPEKKGLISGGGGYLRGLIGSLAISMDV